MPLVPDPNHIRIGIAGKVDDDDHPYSWSAIFNGYDAGAMREFAHPVISRYLAAQSQDDFGVEGAHVTHIWCDDRGDAEKISVASKIPNIVEHAVDLIGKVDAVLIPTDIGDQHVERAGPFVEAGIPLFIDKPLCDNAADLAIFRAWIAQGRPIVSCSAMRYAVEFEQLRTRLAELGELRLVTIAMAKSWRRYGIHALEAIYPFFEPGGWTSVVNTGRNDIHIVHLRHRSGVDALVTLKPDLFGGFGVLHLYGTTGHLTAQFTDSFSAFKRQLVGFVNYLRNGKPPFPFAETDEMTRLLIAATHSRASAACAPVEI